MTNETPQQNTSSTENNQIPFGARLKSARETLGLERKEAAAQLRLNENVIIMIEKDRYPSDLPVTFIRGYIRAYGKLLQIPESEIKKAIEPIKPKPTVHDSTLTLKQPEPMVDSGNYFMQFFTYLIIFTVLGLVGMWWYTHSTPPAQTVESQSLPEPIPTSIQTSPVTPAENAKPSTLPRGNTPALPQNQMNNPQFRAPAPNIMGPQPSTNNNNQPNQSGMNARPMNMNNQPAPSNNPKSVPAYMTQQAPSNMNNARPAPTTNTPSQAPAYMTPQAPSNMNNARPAPTNMNTSQQTSMNSNKVQAQINQAVNDVINENNDDNDYRDNNDNTE